MNSDKEKGSGDKQKPKNSTGKSKKYVLVAASLKRKYCQQRDRESDEDMMPCSSCNIKRKENATKIKGTSTSGDLGDGSLTNAGTSTEGSGDVQAAKKIKLDTTTDGATGYGAGVADVAPEQSINVSEIQSEAGAQALVEANANTHAQRNQIERLRTNTSVLKNSYFCVIC